MKKVFVLLVFAATFSCVASAQDECKYGYGSEKAFSGLMGGLKNAPSCKAASELLDKCVWGSSADAQTAAVVVEKCESEFYPNLIEQDKRNYGEEMQLCAYQYSFQGGTISISEAALCQVGVAKSIAENPKVADKPVPRAGFDCASAHTAVEDAVCSDSALGHADLVLQRDYDGLMSQENLETLLPGVKQALKESQVKWRSTLPRLCALHIPATDKQVNCLRHQYELRISHIDSCTDGEGAACLRESLTDADAQAESSHRASFSCEEPSTALQLVICDDAEIGQSDIRLDALYKQEESALPAEQSRILLDSEKKWQTFVGNSCPMGVVGGVPPLLTRLCVRSAFNVRITQLESCAARQPAQMATCLNDFKLLPAEQKSNSQTR